VKFRAETGPTAVAACLMFIAKLRKKLYEIRINKKVIRLKYKTKLLLRAQAYL